MESTLMVIGVSDGTAPVAVRERFLMRDDHRREALRHLSGAEGIDELIVMATSHRTEFILWTQNAFAASGSVLSFLTQDYGLRLCDWGHFYRKLGQHALAHWLGVLSQADGEPDIVPEAQAAWALAQQAGACKSSLDSVMQKSLSMAGRLRPLGTGQRQAIVFDVAKRLYAELQPQLTPSPATGTRR